MIRYAIIIGHMAQCLSKNPVVDIQRMMSADEVALTILIDQHR